MESKNQTYGLSAENPVMVTDVAMSYSYLDKLMTVHKDLSYRRIKSTFSSSVNGVLDKYEILLNDEHYSFLFIYPYAEEDKFTIAETFETLRN
ncbi:hypothetical protein DCS32_01770 [Dokdonia sp. Dokd-P16]|uniref:hypothetical protein n=1 Tax=Dokdonia sp. Dokd-P16 TaxID=2173169 RepID=UPI000D547C0E|nr:hypothetical protein [Dokdonia sp. Dokd-P16]AWH72933.1 hypothetical protein DCS32_01770 [Dokdonia sp. Dokd-P16]